MAVKFKLGFTISAETLFGIVAKMLPIEDLQVEEVYETPPVKQPAIAKLLAQHRLEAPQKNHKSRNKFNHPDGKTGQQFIIEYLNQMPDKQAKWSELGKYLESIGFARSSVNNGISRLLKDGKIEKVGPAMYGIPKNHMKNK